MTVDVRPVSGPDDVAAAIDVWRRADAARSTTGVAGDDANVRAMLADPSTFAVLAVDDDDGAVAMAQGMEAREDGGHGAPVAGWTHIGMVFVVPERWRGGLGGLVLDAVLAEARRRGYVAAQLWTGRGNHRARPFYEQRGWRWTGEEADNAKHERVVRYVRDL